MHTIYTPRHQQHDTSHLIVEGHPFLIEEVPARAEIIRQAIEQAQLGPIEAPNDHGLGPIQAVHTLDYVEYLQRAFAEYTLRFPKEQAAVAGTFAPASARRKTRHSYGQTGQYAFGVGAPILRGTWEAAYWSAQCALTASDRLLAGNPSAYALCRPPGHHAATNLCGGFCYLNNAAIAAQYLHSQAQAKIAILDVDYHHGNGTQEIFYRDPDVLFCSLHAHPDEDYPFFWGDTDETGEAAGLGCNHNWPLPQGIRDEAYLAVLSEALDVIRAYQPSYLVISLGLDPVQGDPVGGFKLTQDGLATIGKHIVGLGLPTLIVQEGGYLLDQLGKNAAAFLKAFVAKNSVHRQGLS